MGDLTRPREYSSCALATGQGLPEGDALGVGASLGDGGGELGLGDAVGLEDGNEDGAGETDGVGVTGGGLAVGAGVGGLEVGLGVRVVVGLGVGVGVGVGLGVAVGDALGSVAVGLDESEGLAAKVGAPLTGSEAAPTDVDCEGAPVTDRTAPSGPRGANVIARTAIASTATATVPAIRSRTARGLAGRACERVRWRGWATTRIGGVRRGSGRVIGWA